MLLQLIIVPFLTHPVIPSSAGRMLFSSGDPPLYLARRVASGIPKSVFPARLGKLSLDVAQMLREMK